MADEPESPPRRRLTAKQRKWAFNYLITDNASEAARRAGYGHEVRGVENVRKRIVEQFLEELGECAGAMEQTTPDALFAKALDMAKNAENDGTRARCLELAMRAKGMFVSSVEITQKGQDLPSMIAQLQESNPALAALLAKELGVDATSH